jgi:hypothetical protein
MKTFKTFIIGLAALGVSAVAIPAQAHDSHHWSHHGGYHGRVIIHGGPYYHSYYRDYGYYGPSYGYYRPYGYYYGPGISFAFGGHSFGGHVYHHYNHHR